jgi:TRAP-type C4-dicarboxylate transport system permease small subunit
MDSKPGGFLGTVGSALNAIAGVALTCMMFLTFTDVVMRFFGHPILGVYELVSFLLAVVIGFSIPKVSLDRGHVYMEFVLDNLPPKGKAVMMTFTRILCIGLFVAIGVNLFLVGNEFHTAGEVSSTLKIPFFPIAYGVGICCLIECLVFVFDIVAIWRGQHE